MSADLFCCFFQFILKTFRIWKNASNVFAIRPWYLLYVANYHFRMVNKILVVRKPVFIRADSKPCKVFLWVFWNFLFLQNQNIAGYFRSGISGKSAAWKAYCAEKICLFCNILTNFGWFLIHGAFRCDKKYQPTASDLIQRFREEKIMD